MTRKIIPAKPAKARQSPPPDGAKDVLLMIVGSGPAIATLQSLLAAAQANGEIYHEAVENQQRANILAMVATAHAVRVMIEGEPPADLHDDED